MELTSKRIEELKSRCSSDLKESTGPVILFSFDMINAGIRLLYETLCREGFNCRILFIQDWSPSSIEQTISALRQFEPLFFGMGFVSRDAEKAYCLADALKSRFCSVPVFFGGVHPTFFPEEGLSHSDGVCIGEGELCLVEIAYRLLLGLDPRESCNLCYAMPSGEIVKNPLNELISDLDLLPMIRPYTDDHILVRNHGFQIVNRRIFAMFSISSVIRIRILATRGCSNSCAFCCNSGYHRLYENWGSLRTFSVDRIIDEVRMNMRYFPDSTRVFFRDDDFLERDDAWYDEFERKWVKSVDLDFDILASPQSVTGRKIFALKRAGLKLVSLGLQSGSARTNRLFNRKFSRKTFIGAAKIISDHGIGLDILNIIDNPWDKTDDHLQTLKLLTRVPKPFFLTNFSLKLFPGTELSLSVKERKGNLPENLFNYSNFFSLQPNDYNRIFSMVPFTGRKIPFFFFRRLENIWAVALLRFISLFINPVIPLWEFYIYGCRTPLDFVKTLRTMAYVFLLNMADRISLRFG